MNHVSDIIGEFDYSISWTVEAPHQNKKGLKIRVINSSKYGLDVILCESSKTKCTISNMVCVFKNDISNIDHEIIAKELKGLFALERLGNL